MNCNEKADQARWECDLDMGYREMGQNEARELEALDYAEATIADVSEEVT